MKGSVRGLTTAAGIWMVSTIGLAVGVGLYILSVAATLLILIILVTLEGVERRHAMGSESRIIRMKVREIVTDIEPYRTVLERHDVRLVNEYVDYDYIERTTRLNLIVLSRESLDYIRLFGELSALLPTDSITLSNQLQ